MNIRLSVLGSIALMLAALSVATPAMAQKVPRPLGVELLPWASRVEENRYKSPRDWDKTLKVFRDRWRRSRSVKIHPIVNLPTVKYVHYESLNAKTRWSGINVYQVGNKGVRITVLPRLSTPETKRAPK